MKHGYTNCPRKFHYTMVGTPCKAGMDFYADFIDGGRSDSYVKVDFNQIEQRALEHMTEKRSSNDNLLAYMAGKRFRVHAGRLFEDFTGATNLVVSMLALGRLKAEEGTGYICLHSAWHDKAAAVAKLFFKPDGNFMRISMMSDISLNEAIKTCRREGRTCTEGALVDEIASRSKKTVTLQVQVSLEIDRHSSEQECMNEAMESIASIIGPCGKWHVRSVSR